LSIRNSPLPKQKQFFEVLFLGKANLNEVHFQGKKQFLESPLPRKEESRNDVYFPRKGKSLSDVRFQRKIKSKRGPFYRKEESLREVRFRKRSNPEER
jgi:hypothetical protein